MQAAVEPPTPVPVLLLSPPDEDPPTPPDVAPPLPVLPVLVPLLLVEPPLAAELPDDDAQARTPSQTSPANANESTSERADILVSLLDTP